MLQEKNTYRSECPEIIVQIAKQLICLLSVCALSTLLMCSDSITNERIHVFQEWSW